MKAFFRGSLATLVGSVALFGASSAHAEGEACFNDIDCPGTMCGDAVCNWPKPANTPTADKPYYCNPAGTQPRHMDGWCTTTADCKCAGMGATCVGTYCSFTKPGDAPAGTAGASAGGSSAGGATSAAGTTSTAGTATSTAGTAASTAGTGTTPPAASSDSGGGCSFSAPIGSRGGAALALGVLGLGLALSRRRR